MAYDEELAARIRARMEDEPGMTEKKMFGGIGWMLDGNMAVGAGSKGSLMLRVDPKTGHELIDDHVQPMHMQGRTMNGWLLADADVLGDDEKLHDLMQHGIDYARSLPPK
ncbi:MAG TPA: TfoX/Sxy family protein [Phycicoccus sp.]|jgi:TfoX/Sxy family transcriptional regulator of competence genes|nr:TfoX/Sxy family protein [Phycicoccus sp.]